MRKLRLHQKVVAGLALVAFGAGVFAFVREPPRVALLDRAHGWQRTQDKFDTTFDYRWVSAQTVLTLQPASGGDYEPVELDVVTGEVTARPPASPLLGGPARRTDAFAAKFSPDGRSVLLAAGPPTNTSFVAVTLDGRTRVAWQKPFETFSVGWLPDNRGWLELATQNERTLVRRYSLDSREVKQCFVNLPPFGRLLGWTKDHAAFVTWDRQRSGRKLGCAWLYPDGNSFIPKTAAIKLPARAVVREFKLSPDGGRIAWIFSITRRWPQFQKTPKPPGFRRVDHVAQSLWISGVDGGGMRELGRLQPRETISGLNWQPDSRSVSFVFQDTLWTVAVD